MTLTDLIAAFRTEADDQTAPYLWSDSEIVGYLNDAENEACIRANLLVEEQTLILAAGQQSVGLDPRVLDVAEVRRVIGRLPLRRESIAGFNGWPSNGTPRGYALSGRILYVRPIPQTPETLWLRIYRLPSEPLVLDWPNSEPEIPTSEHLRLLDWALYRAFSKRDADTYEKNRGMDYGARFEANFGPRPSAHARQQYRDAAEHRVTAIIF